MAIFSAIFPVVFFPIECPGMNFFTLRAALQLIEGNYFVTFLHNVKLSIVAPPCLCSLSGFFSLYPISVLQAHDSPDQD